MDNASDTDTAARLVALEARVAALESTSEPIITQSRPHEEELWLLQELQNREPFPDGSVIFGGEVIVGGQRAMYQWQRPTHVLTDNPWDANLERLAALAHPVRGAILRRLLAAPATASDLVEEDTVSSTGTTYHHLGALTASGWISKDAAGRHSVRTSRVVALLTIIAATEDH